MFGFTHSHKVHFKILTRIIQTAVIFFQQLFDKDLKPSLIKCLLAAKLRAPGIYFAFVS